MNKKLLPGSVVVLKSTRDQVGKTTLTMKTKERTKLSRTGAALNPVPPMVIMESAKKSGILVAHCYYYSAQLDQFVDRWIPMSILLSVLPPKPESIISVGDVVTFGTALLNLEEKDYRYEFTLENFEGDQKYVLQKSFDSSYHRPPIMDVVKVRKKDEEDTALCMWQSRKTGRLFEAELPIRVLLHQFSLV